MGVWTWDPLTPGGPLTTVKQKPPPTGGVRVLSRGWYTYIYIYIYIYIHTHTYTLCCLSTSLRNAVSSHWDAEHDTDKHLRPVIIISSKL